jgi:hypothetical protein
MATLKICTHDRTRWITDVQEVVIAESFSVTHFDDPLKDCRASHATVRGNDIRLTVVADFQKPIPEESVPGDYCGYVLHVTRSDKPDYIYQYVVPQRACFLMSDAGKTIDRI